MYWVLTDETVKLYGSTENKITKDKAGENIPHVETNEVVSFIVTLSTMIIN